MSTKTKSRDKSAILYKEALKFTPLGVHSNVRFYKPYPIFIKKAKGTKIVDINGNEYVDFSMNYGASLVGHAHPLIVKALHEQVQEGTLYTMPHKHSIDLAREIVKRFPIEQVRFTNSGTEATIHAIRLARGYTGKDKIIRMGGCYHGVHDSTLTEDNPKDLQSGEPAPLCKGIPSKTLKNTLVSVFNDLDSIKNLFRQYRGQIAGVILEPLMMNRGIILPEQGFLENVKELCQTNEALLIFDEVKTGVKVSWGGACEYYDIKPDIICLAKAIGGGLPLGAFGASKELMYLIESGEVIHAGTYNANPLSVIAGLVALRDILNKGSYERVFKLNEKLAEGYNSIIEKCDLPAHAVLVGACGTIHFSRNLIKDHQDWATHVDVKMSESYWKGMLAQGVIPCPYPLHREEWTVSVQHREEDIDVHLEAFEKVAHFLQEENVS